MKNPSSYFIFSLWENASGEYKQMKDYKIIYYKIMRGKS